MSAPWTSKQPRGSPDSVDEAPHAGIEGAPVAADRCEPADRALELLHRLLVATAAGAFAGLVPIAVLIGVVVWAAVVRLSGYVSLGSILGVAAFAVSVRPLYPQWNSVDWTAVILWLFIVFTHRENIRRLLKGTERRIGRSAAKDPPAPGQTA